MAGIIISALPQYAQLTIDKRSMSGVSAPRYETVAGEMETANLVTLESSERDFRKAAKLLASMLEPPSGKVKFRVFGYVRFGFNACQHQMQVTAGGGGAGPGAVRLGECVLGWTNLIKERENLHLTFIDLKSEDMKPDFSAVINEDATLEIVSPREVAFHFKHKTTVQVLMSLDQEMDRVTELFFAHNKKRSQKSVRSSKTPPQFVSRPVLIRLIADSPDSGAQKAVLQKRPTTPVIPRQWVKVTMDKRTSVSLESLGRSYEKRLHSSDQ